MKNIFLIDKEQKVFQQKDSEKPINEVINNLSLIKDKLLMCYIRDKKDTYIFEPNKKEFVKAKNHYMLSLIPEPEDFEFLSEQFPNFKFPILDNKKLMFKFLRAFIEKFEIYFDEVNEFSFDADSFNYLGFYEKYINDKDQIAYYEIFLEYVFNYLEMDDKKVSEYFLSNGLERPVIVREEEDDSYRMWDRYDFGEWTK